MNPDNALHDAILAMESRIQTVEFTQWNLESRAQKVKSTIQIAEVWNPHSKN